MVILRADGGAQDEVMPVAELAGRQLPGGDETPRESLDSRPLGARPAIPVGRVKPARIENVLRVAQAVDGDIQHLGGSVRSQKEREECAQRGPTAAAIAAHVK